MPQGKKILIVEDEADLAGLIRYNLQREGYRCRCAADGRTAIAEVRLQAPDLIILDRMLPERSGDEVLTYVRGDPRSATIPVLMLTAKADEADELVGFALGADDYITKPFSMKRLLARTTALLRRVESAGQSGEVLSEGPYSLDRGRREVTVGGVPVPLTPTEFRMLGGLMAGHGQVLQRERLIDVAMGPDVAVTDRTIDVHIASLRKKVGKASTWIHTVRGVGYAFRAPDHDVSDDDE